MDPFSFLGKPIVDNVSGMKGICTSVTEYHSGMIQIAVQPKGDGEKYPEAFNFDPHNISINENYDGPEIKVVPIEVEPYELGSKIVTKLSRIKGGISKRTTWINGCVVYTVEGELNPKDNSVTSYIIQHNDIDKVTPPKKKDEPAKQKTGGPVTKVARL